MTLFKVTHDKHNPYTSINTTIASDTRISWKAKGIWLYAFSRPDDWKFYKSDLLKQSRDGEESLQTGLKELEAAGYLHRCTKHNEKGQILGWEWFFFETPKTPEEIKKLLPKRGFSPQRGNPALPIIDYSLNTNSQVENLREDRQASLPVVEKKKILEKSFPDLQPQQVMQLSKNFTERDLRLAAEYALLQEKIEHPYSWISKCIRGKWWESADQAQMKGASLFDSLKTAIFALQTKIGTNLGIYASKDYLSFNTPIGGFSIKPENLTSDERIKTLVEAINDSLRFNFKLCYVNLPAQKGFEIL